MEQTQHVHNAAGLHDASSVSVVAERDGRHVVLHVYGEVDAHTCDRLRSALMSALEDGPEAVRVDVGTLSFCDLAGSDVLHAFAQAAAARAVVVDFTGMSPLLTLMYTRFAPRSTPGRQDGRWLPDGVCDTAGQVALALGTGGADHDRRTTTPSDR